MMIAPSSYRQRAVNLALISFIVTLIVGILTPAHGSRCQAPSSTAEWSIPERNQRKREQPPART